MSVNKSLNTPALVSKSPKRCGSCSGCLAEDCLICKFCKRKKIYGCPGRKKQSCSRHKCLSFQTKR